MVSGRRKLPSLVVALYVRLLHTRITTHTTASSFPINSHCVLSERDALLRFRGSFNNPSGYFSSWIADQGCCRWQGVGCNNSTGHVIALDISNQDQTSFSEGEFVASLAGLPFLRYLDFSRNNFRQMKIPTLIGSLANLERLNLSSANFKGPIPDHLGNLSRLRSVDLSGNSFSLVANNLHWLHGLISLKVLDLGGVDLSAVGDWFDSINMLPSLLQLKLKGCRMKNFQTSHLYINFTSLEVLALSKNSFNSLMPRWLSNTSQTLVHLNIQGSQLRGSIPNYFGDMTSLAVLDLSDNQLEGGIPRTLGSNRTQSSELRVLYLSSNRLNGSLCQILLQKPNLVTLDVGSNSLSEVIYETQLKNLSRLRDFRVGNNLLTFRIRSGWVPSFQLQLINLSSCQLGPQFPMWLQSQREFSSLDISGTGISDTVPDWFWNVSNMVKYVDMSLNGIRGRVPDLSMNFNLDTLNLRDNQFEGPLPHFYPGMVLLDLSNNSFSGSISSICEMLVPGNTLSYLALDYNILSGEVPDCWMHGQNLNVLSLSMNNLNGTIPNSIGHLTRLKWLQLQFNGFSGELPLSLKNCSDLSLLSVAENKLSGSIPAWIGEEVQYLKALNLRAIYLKEISDRQ